MAGPGTRHDRRVRSWVRDHAVLTYALLAYGSSWAWWVPMLVRGDVVRRGDGWPTHLPGLLGPAVAAVVVTVVIEGRPGVAELGARVARWRVGWSWWLLVAGTAALALLGLVVPLLTGDDVPGLQAFSRYSGMGELGLAGMLVVAFVVNGLGEETGWRGFAVERLLARRGLTATAVVVGALWAGWHLPLFWINDSFRSFGALGILGWTIGLAAGSVVLTWIYRGAGHSVLLAAAWHTAFNLTSATEATGDVVPAISSTLVIVVAVAVVRRDRGRTRRSDRTPHGGRTSRRG